MLIFYHYPSCSKSRLALQWLEASTARFTLIDYAKEGLALDFIQQLFAHLGPKAVLRSTESLFQTLDLAKADEATLALAIITHPELLQRPILQWGERFIVARPPEKIKEFLYD